MKDETITLLYKNITLSTLFLESVETSVSVKERQGDEGRHTEDCYIEP